ncbi:MAG: hypothetical protein KDB02_03870 [Acidimicrobiales bacterium]|nr:hypothetical protein [Acidimicrobiales bacterium]MCB1247217.1 hypothetical protein [Acidimicrobiia bacterium]
MGYVMVPVPEHHQKEFGVWLLQITMRAALAAWTPERVQRAIDRLDDTDARIVLRVASTRGFWLDAATVAKDLGMDTEDMLGRIHAMNQACYDDEAPPIVMVKSADQSRSGRPELMMNHDIRADMMKALG